MSPLVRMLSAMDALQWSQRDLARATGIDERTVRRWATGRMQPPEAILDWLDDLALHVQSHPPPRGP